MRRAKLKEEIATEMQRARRTDRQLARLLAGGDGEQGPETETIDAVFESRANVLFDRYETGYHYHGLIDDLRIHAHALSAEESQERTMRSAHGRFKKGQGG